MTKQELINILDFYKCPCDIVFTRYGTGFIDYFLNPLNGTTIRKLKTRQEDFTLSIGQPAFIEVENNSLILRVRQDGKQAFNYFEYLINMDKKPGQLAIGLNPAGEYIQSNLFDMPHLLIAGQTGSGKSVFLHNCILSLLINNECCFRMIDLKRVELSIYNGINQLIGDVITDHETAAQVLVDEVNEMQARYRLMEQYGVNHYTLLPENKQLLARIIIIDELSDLMLNKATRKAVENSIVRIAQLGRAAGVHLILATQRPSREVITGLIKANIPSKISFTVANRYDSQVIGIANAEKLTGKGDGLFLETGKQPQRVQAFFIENNQLNDFVRMLKERQAKRRQPTPTRRQGQRKGIFKKWFS